MPKADSLPAKSFSAKSDTYVKVTVMALNKPNKSMLTINIYLKYTKNKTKTTNNVVIPTTTKIAHLLKKQTIHI